MLCLVGIIYLCTFIAQSLPSIMLHPTDAVVRQDAVHIFHCIAFITSEF